MHLSGSANFILLALQPWPRPNWPQSRDITAVGYSPSDIPETPGLNGFVIGSLSDFDRLVYLPRPLVYSFERRGPIVCLDGMRHRGDGSLIKTFPLMLCRSLSLLGTPHATWRARQTPTLGTLRMCY